MAALVADGQALEGMQPGESALDDPADTAEAGAVGGVAPSDPVADAAGAELAAVLVLVIAAVGVDDVGSVSGSSAATGDRADAVKKRHQLGDIVAVAGRDGGRQRQAVGVDDEVMFGA